MIFMKISGHLEVVGELLLNRFGKTNILGLSTRRDLHVSGIHFVWKNPERKYFLQNMTSIFQFFESRRPDRPSQRTIVDAAKGFKTMRPLKGVPSIITEIRRGKVS